MSEEVELGSEGCGCAAGAVGASADVVLDVDVD